MSDTPWGPVDAAAWRSVPHLQDRLARQDDVAAGRAVFYLDADPARCRVAGLSLPACGIQTLDDGRERPVIVIQAEVLGGRTLVGVRYLEGGSGVCEAGEVQLLPGPDERFGG